MILSLGRFRIAPTEHVKGLEKGWAAHRKQYGLDLYGKAAEPAKLEALTCAHPDLPG
jgi:hypothetical protein